MTYKGTVKNGVVVLPPNIALPEGTEVDVTVRSVAQKQDPLVGLVRQLAKARSHLPADYALNHGHYVRGEPKK